MSMGHKNCYWQFSWLLFLFSVIIVICLLWSPFGKYYTKIMTSFGSKCHHLSKGSSPHLNGLLNIRKMVIYFNTLKTPFLTTYLGTNIFFSCFLFPLQSSEIKSASTSSSTVQSDPEMLPISDCLLMIFAGVNVTDVKILFKSIPRIGSSLYLIGCLDTRMPKAFKMGVIYRDEETWTWPMEDLWRALQYFRNVDQCW